MKNRWKKKKMKVSRVLDIKIENFQAQKLKIKLRKSFQFKIYLNSQMKSFLIKYSVLINFQKHKKTR